MTKTKIFSAIVALGLMGTTNLYAGEEMYADKDARELTALEFKGRVKSCNAVLEPLKAQAYELLGNHGKHGFGPFKKLLPPAYLICLKTGQFPDISMPESSAESLKLGVAGAAALKALYQRTCSEDLKRNTAELDKQLAAADPGSKDAASEYISAKTRYLADYTTCLENVGTDKCKDALKGVAGLKDEDLAAACR